MVVFLGVAGVAEAHAILLSSEPTIGSLVARAPTVLTLHFSEPVTIGARPLRMMLARSGREVRLGHAHQISAGRTLLVPLLASTDAASLGGVLIVDWSVVSDDGDPVSGEYQFAVGSGTPRAAARPTLFGTVLPAPLRVLAQWLSIGGITLALFALLRPFRTTSSDARIVALAGAAAAALGRVIMLADLSARSGTRTALDGRAGLAAAVAAILFVMVGVAALRTRRGSLLLLVGAALAMISGGHAAAAVAEPFGTLLWGTHLLAGAAWLGTLAGLVLLAGTARDREEAELRSALAAYTRIALVSVALLVASASVIAWSEIGSLGALVETAYGRIAIAKTVLLLGALAIATWQRTRTLRTLATKRRSFSRLLRIELAALTLATLLGGVLADTLPGAAEQRAQSLASQLAPPSGAAVQLAALAGRYTVFLAARPTSITVSVLGLDGAPLEHADVELSIENRNGTPGPLETRTCGRGCYSAPTPTRIGSRRVTIAIHTATATGSASFAVPATLPPSQGALLARVIAKLRARTNLRLSEAVTSDGDTTGRSRPIANTSGASFAKEALLLPDGAIDARLELDRRDPPGVRVLSFFLPGASVWHALSITRDERLLQDHWITPRHSITTVLR